MRKLSGALLAGMMMAYAPNAFADEAWVGVLAHEVDTPFSLATKERGADIQLGWRGERISGLRAIGKPAPYAFVSANTAGDTSFAAAGLSWTIGKKALYFRPAIGLAIHTGEIKRFDRRGRRLDLGSRVLFEPELALGVRLSGRMSLEANWTHISNATLLSKQNPGLDMMGMRLNFGI